MRAGCYISLVALLLATSCNHLPIRPLGEEPKLDVSSTSFGREILSRGVEFYSDRTLCFGIDGTTVRGPPAPPEFLRSAIEAARAMKGFTRGGTLRTPDGAVYLRKHIIHPTQTTIRVNGNKVTRFSSVGFGTLKQEQVRAAFLEFVFGNMKSCTFREYPEPTSMNVEEPWGGLPHAFRTLEVRALRRDADGRFSEVIFSAAQTICNAKPGGSDAESISRRPLDWPSLVRLHRTAELTARADGGTASQTAPFALSTRSPWPEEQFDEVEPEEADAARSALWEYLKSGMENCRFKPAAGGFLPALKNRLRGEPQGRAVPLPKRRTRDRNDVDEQVLPQPAFNPSK